MDLFDAIKERYSYRGSFKNTTISVDHLKKIVQAGLDAPSAGIEKYVSPELKGPDEIGSSERIIDDEGYAVFMGDNGHFFHIDNICSRFPDGFDENRLGSRSDCCSKILGIIRVDKEGLYAVPGKRIGK